MKLKYNLEITIERIIIKTVLKEISSITRSILPGKSLLKCLETFSY